MSLDGHDRADGARAEVWNWLTRGRHPVTGLDQRLLADRNAIRNVLGKHG
jgi:hypothetical protein